jgi:DNA-binding beta-propeller fold protein YncE
LPSSSSSSREIKNKVRVFTDVGTFEADAAWAKLPNGWSFREVAGIATDSRSRVYVFSRSEHPMMVFDSEGNFITSWGEDVFVKAHNVRVSPDGFVYCSDLNGHTIRKFTPEGKLLMTLGTPNVPSDTGGDGRNSKIKWSAGPFNGPTDIAFAPSGELYISDGYANARVHKFSAGGELVTSWGEPGDGPAQFNLPHNALMGKDATLFVADRENNRVQVLTPEGEFISQWTDFAAPTGLSMSSDGVLAVSEFGYDPASGPSRYSTPPHGRKILPRVTMRSQQGELLGKIEGEDKCSPGNFFAPHGVCLDRNGDIYVAEVPITRRAPGLCHTLQKFVKQ